jgi:hypothetical protein
MKNLAIKKALVCFGLSLSLALLSERSGYNLKSEVDSMNWDIALMLSPFGLLRAYVLEPNFYLRPYYAEASERGELFRDPVLLALIVCVGACAVTGLGLLRSSRLGSK